MIARVFRSHSPGNSIGPEIVNRQARIPSEIPPDLIPVELIWMRKAQVRPCGRVRFFVPVRIKYFLSGDIADDPSRRRVKLRQCCKTNQLHHVESKESRNRGLDVPMSDRPINSPDTFSEAWVRSRLVVSKLKTSWLGQTGKKQSPLCFKNATFLDFKKRLWKCRYL